jgi:hypothetical protein
MVLPPGEVCRDAEPTCDRACRIEGFLQQRIDRVTMPPRNLLVSAAEEYSATLLHELRHYADLGIMPSFLGLPFCGRALVYPDIGIIRL